MTGLATRAEGHAFGDWHIYAVPNGVDLRDRETKQFGFITARGLTSRTRLVYDGLALDLNRYHGWSQDTIRNQGEFGIGAIGQTR